MRKGRWVAAGVVLVLVWAALAYCAGPPSGHGYRRTAVQVAQAALDAVRTAALAGDADLDGKLLDPYQSVVLDDALGAVAGAQSQLAAESPPDADTRRMRDQLVPLLTDATRQLVDLVLTLAGGDQASARARTGDLHHLGDQLDDFVARYR